MRFAEAGSEQAWVEAEGQKQQVKAASCMPLVQHQHLSEPAHTLQVSRQFLTTEILWDEQLQAGTQRA